jgi:hypothetical protein
MVLTGWRKTKMERWARRVLREEEKEGNMKKDKEFVVPDKEPIKPGKEPQATSADDYRASVRRMMETEVGNIIEDEIKAAAKELVEEQRMAIREAVGEHKRIIREVLEEEKLAIRARVEELRASIVKLGMG